MKTCPQRHQRSGFTVVEILVAITVIAILAAMLVPTIGAAFKRSNEFAIETEVNQLNQALEQFNIKYGFYPPSFQQFNDGDDVLPYLNRISPNHAYAAGDLDDWWTNVGSEIKGEPGADIVFWLSGISNNRQYPLTNTDGDYIPGFDDGNTTDPNTNQTIEREVFFEFNQSRLVRDTYFATYTQARGPERPYRYLDAPNYGDISSSPLGYHNGTEFANPDTFQILAFGMDGEQGNLGNVRQVGALGVDNIVNFSFNGGASRLENAAFN